MKPKKRQLFQTRRTKAPKAGSANGSLHHYFSGKKLPVQTTSVLSVRHFRLLFNTMLQGVVFQDAAGRIIAMNPAARQILGKTRMELSGKTSMDVERHTIREDGSPFPGIKHPSMVALQTGKEVRDVVMGVYNPREKRYRWININAVPLFRANEARPYQVYTIFDDITERKKAEGLAKTSREAMEQAQRLAGVGSWEWNLETGQNQWSREVYRIYEHSPALPPITYPQVKRYFVPAGWKKLVQAVEQCRTRGTAYECDLEMVLPGGRHRWITACGEAVRDVAGRIVRLRGTVQDITERKRAEAALQAANVRLNKVLEVETVGVMFWDAATGVMIDANDTFLKAMGYSRQEVEAGRLTWQKLTPPEFMESSREELRKFATTGRVGPYEKEYVRKDGTRRWFVFAGSALGDGAIVEFCVDISARKWAEARLRETKEQIQYFVDNTKDILFQIDLAGNYTFGNAAAERVTGYTLSQLLRMNLRQLVSPEYRDLVWERLQRRIAGEVDEKSFEIEILHRDGRRIWLELTTSPVRHPEGRLMAIQGVAREITDRKKTETILRQTNRTLQTIRDCHEAILRAETESELLREICRIIAQTGCEQMVWVGYADNDARKTVRPVAVAGGQNYLANAHITWADKPRGRGPVGTAIRTGKVCLCHNTQTDPRFAPWRSMVQRYKFGSVIALPLLRDGKCFGALSIYAPEPEAFDSAEQSLLTDLANDLAFGIQALRLRAEREHLENEILKSIERERERIGRDLHDGLCQILVGAKFRSAYLQKITNDWLPEAGKEAEELEDVLNKAIKQSRDLARGLNPVKVTPAGLSLALKKLAADTQNLAGPRCVFQNFGVSQVADHHTANHLYRIAQEAVQNAFKHAWAKNISIMLVKDGQHIILTVKDDGSGIPARIKNPGMGLNNMRMRASLIGGHLEIRHRKKGGTAVTCEIQLRQRNQHEDKTKNSVPTV